MNFLNFLNSKPLYYDEIDYSRMPRVYETIKSKLKPLKIIHLIGTNGKGTTGRFLASALYNLGYKVGHYTSPHILKFNERVWLNGEDASDEVLQKAHLQLLSFLSKDDAHSLSYFEYTTLLAMVVYEDCDYVVLEAGLGGEHDATAVFTKELTLVTPIDYDHEAFLGDTIQEITTTKLKAIQQKAIIGKQKHKKVLDIASTLVPEVYFVDGLVDLDDLVNVKAISKKLSLASYLQDNLKLAISALKVLDIKYTKENFKDARLFGRLSKISPNIYVDVGHNILASNSILEALKGKKYTLVYNSYKDKNYKAILTILKPIIKNIEVIDIDEDRIVDRAILDKTILELGLSSLDFKEIDNHKDYLVFGSFSVVENFIRDYYE